MVKVFASSDGKPYAIVVDDDEQAEASAAPDGSAVTVVLSKQGEMPCSLIVPGHVAEEAFGPDIVALLPVKERGDASDPGAPQDFTGGGG